MIDEGILTLNAEVRNGDAIAPAFISSRSGALYLSSSDRPTFKAHAHAEGPSTIAGIRHIVLPAATNKLILVDGASIVVSDNGLRLDSSSQASVVLDTAPTSPAAMTSAFQTNSAILRAVRTIHWLVAHDDAIAYLELPLLEGGSPGL